MRIKLFSIAVILGGCLPIASHADPLPIRDLNPLLAGFELATALPSNTRRNSIDLSYAISNITLDQQAGSEHVIDDSELHRWQLTATRNINSHWSIQVDLPYQTISGGSLDGFIENFHSTFNLPNGNRAVWPHNRLLIDYSIAGQSQFHVAKSSSGVGDIAIHTGWHFASSSTQSASLWFTAKLPTGSSNALTGSGATDVSVALGAQQQLSAEFHTFEQLSLAWLGTGARLADEQKRSAWSGMVGLSWSLSNALDTTVQLNSHSAIYNSNVRMLGNATQVTIGPRFHSAQWQAWLCITEDIIVDTAPDVQFQFSLSRSF